MPVRLGWDINADVDAIVAEFYRNMFGPAAQIVAQYGQMFEDVMANTPKDAARDYERAFVNGMTPEFFGRASDLLDEAENAVGSADIRDVERHAIHERLRRYRFGLRLTEQLALVKQYRLAGRMVLVREHLATLSAVLDEIAADPELIDMIELPAAMRQAREERERLPAYELIWEQAMPSPEDREQLRRRLDEGHTREVARALGYWNDWHIVGLWTNPGGEPTDTHYPPEDDVDLSATYEVRGGEGGWLAHECRNPYGIVDLREFFRPQDSQNTVAYAWADIRATEDATVHVAVTYDDDMLMWINDEPVFSNRTNRPGLFEAELREGSNRILVKALNKPHGFKFSVRLSDGGRTTAPGRRVGAG